MAMNSILFPTDFSDAAENAQTVALSLAKQLDAKLHFLHSLNTVQQYVDMSLTSTGDPTMPGMEPELVIKAMTEQRLNAESALKRLVVEANEDGIEAEFHIVNENLEVAINKVVKDLSVGLIVMGTRGASGFREAFIGSNAQRVVRKCTVPVLTVNRACTKFNVNKVVYASDYLEKEINDQIPRVSAFAKSFGAQLHLIYVNTMAYFEESSDTLKRINSIKEQYEIEDAEVFIYNDYDIDDGILHYADMVNADLIAIVTHGFSGLKKIVSDNVAESVVNHSKIPVLTLHIH